MQHWNRRYFALQSFKRKKGSVKASARLIYSDFFNSRPKKVFELTEDTKATISTEFSREDKAQTLKITHLYCSEEGLKQIAELHLYNENVDAILEWKATIEKCVDRINDLELEKLPGPSPRLFEGMIFKLTKATPHRWVERHFELNGTILSYKHSPVEEVRWTINLEGAKITPNKCTKDSHPTTYILQLKKGETLLNLCFPTEQSYLNWMKAIVQNLELLTKLSR